MYQFGLVDKYSQQGGIDNCVDGDSPWIGVKSHCSWWK